MLKGHFFFNESLLKKSQTFQQGPLVLKDFFSKTCVADSTHGRSRVGDYILRQSKFRRTWLYNRAIACVCTGGRAAMLIARNPSVLLLCVSPTFEQLPHGHHHPAVRAIALQDTQRVRRLHKAHAQLVRWASERQSRQPDHARETARHVEIGAFGLCVCRVCSAGGTPLAQ